MALAFFYILVLVMVLGVPIVFALIFAPMVGIMLQDKLVFLSMMPQRIFSGINQFPLLAIPMFILAGEIMNHGGITIRLVNFANSIVGHLRGGLAQVNVVSSMLFAGLSGSAVADTSALGSILIPAMEKDGYTRRFSAAITAASSVIGPVIPPSIIMVVYAYIMGVSVAGLFAAGFIPGILMGGGLMLMTGHLAKKRNYPKAERRATAAEVRTAFTSAFLPLLTPVIILGGILSGVFTPTEAAAAAVAYALLLSLFVTRTPSVRQLPDMLYRSGIASSSILLVIGAATVFGWVTSLSGMPTAVSGLLLGISDNPWVVLLCVNLLLLIVGMFFDAGPAILILGPLIGPTVIGLGVDPLHFAIVMCVNLTIGLATPPMGLVLFVASTLTRLSIVEIAKDMWPFLFVHLVVILLITYIPALTMTLPRLLGLAG
ncbi:MAG: TRAP transporter large permease [Geminicoccaceae bacterium]|nr:TRAP transporter large permease [Geminicoccaceae bacterium]